jgi:hypothetical protein
MHLKSKREFISLLGDLSIENVSELNHKTVHAQCINISYQHCSYRTECQHACLLAHVFWCLLIVATVKSYIQMLALWLVVHSF